MTEEIKTCDCKEKAIKKLQEFAFISGAVFIGALLAILLSAYILKPKCPPCNNGMMGPYPRIERQLPPPPMMYDHMGGPGREFRGPRDGHHPQFREHRGHRYYRDFDRRAKYRGEHPKADKHFSDKMQNKPVKPAEK